MNYGLYEERDRELFLDYFELETEELFSAIHVFDSSDIMARQRKKDEKERKYYNKRDTISYLRRYIHCNEKALDNIKARYFFPRYTFPDYGKTK